LPLRFKHLAVKREMGGQTKNNIFIFSVLEFQNTNIPFEGEGNSLAESS